MFVDKERLVALGDEAFTGVSSLFFGAILNDCELLNVLHSLAMRLCSSSFKWMFDVELDVFRGAKFTLDTGSSVTRVDAGVCVLVNICSVFPLAVFTSAFEYIFEAD